MNEAGVSKSVAMEFELGPGLPGWQEPGGMVSCNGAGCSAEHAVLLPARTAEGSDACIEPLLKANQVAAAAVWAGGSSTGLPAFTHLLPLVSPHAKVRAGGGLRLVGCTICLSSI